MELRLKNEKLDRVVRWFRAGYPEWFPRGEYVTLLGVLRRRITDEEVASIASALTEARSRRNGLVTEDAIRSTIRKRMFSTASDDDVVRVSARLSAAGLTVAETA